MGLSQETRESACLRLRHRRRSRPSAVQPSLYKQLRRILDSSAAGRPQYSCKAALATAVSAIHDRQCFRTEAETSLRDQAVDVLDVGDASQDDRLILPASEMDLGKGNGAGRCTRKTEARGGLYHDEQLAEVRFGEFIADREPTQSVLLPGRQLLSPSQDVVIGSEVIIISPRDDQLFVLVGP